MFFVGKTYWAILWDIFWCSKSFFFKTTFFIASIKLLIDNIWCHAAYSVYQILPDVSYIGVGIMIGGTWQTVFSIGESRFSNSSLSKSTTLTTSVEVTNDGVELLDDSPLTKSLFMFCPSNMDLNGWDCKKSKKIPHFWISQNTKATAKIVPPRFQSTAPWSQKWLQKTQSTVLYM